MSLYKAVMSAAVIPNGVLRSSSQRVHHRDSSSPRSS
jgi:hypothetical protein